MGNVESTHELFIMIEIQLSLPRILGLRESDCQPKRSEYNTARWTKGESSAKSYAIRRAEQLNAQHNGRLAWRLEKLKKTPPAKLWSHLVEYWEACGQWAVRAPVAVDEEDYL